MIDPQKRIVTAGHALFQPRVAVELEAANKSFFAKIFGGLGGVDPYGSGQLSGGPNVQAGIPIQGDDVLYAP